MGIQVCGGKNGEWVGWHLLLQKGVKFGDFKKSHKMTFQIL